MQLGARELTSWSYCPSAGSCGPLHPPKPTPETLRASQVHTEQSAAQNWTGLWPQDKSQEGKARFRPGSPDPDLGGGSSSLQREGCDPTGSLAHVSLAWPLRGRSRG